MIRLSKKISKRNWFIPWLFFWTQNSCKFNR